MRAIKRLATPSLLAHTPHTSRGGYADKHYRRYADSKEAAKNF